MADGEDKVQTDVQLANTDHLEFVGRMIAQLKIQEKAMAVMGGVPGIGPGSVQSQQYKIWQRPHGECPGRFRVRSYHLMLAWAAADDSRKEHRGTTADA
eukprot:2076499-Rhodomonas_salina.1